MIVVAGPAVVAADKVLNDNNVRPGLLGLFFFVALFVATYFLWRSMNKQLGKVDKNLPSEPRRSKRVVIPIEGVTPAPGAADVVPEAEPESADPALEEPEPDQP